MKIKFKSLDKVELDEDLYEVIVARYENIIEANDSNDSGITLKNIAMVTDDIKHGKKKIEISRLEAI